MSIESNMLENFVAVLKMALMLYLWRVSPIRTVTPSIYSRKAVLIVGLGLSRGGRLRYRAMVVLKNLFDCLHECWQPQEIKKISQQLPKLVHRNCRGIRNGYR